MPCEEEGDVAVFGAYFLAPSSMPTLYLPEQLLLGDVPEIPALMTAPVHIAQTLARMHQEGEIVGATSYGSLFLEGARITCASDVDWLVVFADHDAMLRSRYWRGLCQFLGDMHVGFHGPILTQAMVRSGNHSLSSLLHGVRRATRRIITGEDPLELFARAGTWQNDVASSLQLFGSFPRFFFEQYAYGMEEPMPLARLVDMLSDAVSMWKDVLSVQLVRLIPSDATIPVGWHVYEQLYHTKISPEALAAGARIEAFVRMYVLTMQEYERFREEGTPLDDFVEDYRIYLEESRHIVADAAHFVEANILEYRAAVTRPLSRALQDAKNAVDSLPISSSLAS